MAKRPGRPPLDRSSKSVVVSLTLHAKAFDRVYRLARDGRLTVPEVIRRELDNSANKKTENNGA